MLLLTCQPASSTKLPARSTSQASSSHTQPGGSHTADRFVYFLRMRPSENGSDLSVENPLSAVAAHKARERVEVGTLAYQRASVRGVL